MFPPYPDKRMATLRSTGRPAATFNNNLSVFSEALFVKSFLLGNKLQNCLFFVKKKFCGKSKMNLFFYLGYNLLFWLNNFTEKLGF